MKDIYSHEGYDHVWAVKRILLIFIAVLTALGNTALLVATWREKSLHQPYRYFIASRAVADLFVGIFSAPEWLKQFEETESASGSESVWPSTDLCNFIVWIDTLVFSASICTLTFLSYERYLKLGKPLQYRTRMTTSKSLKMIFIIWIISAVFATYAATPHSGSIGIRFSAYVCWRYDRTKQFYTFVAVCVFFLPITIIVIMCARIFLLTYRRHKLLKNEELRQTLDHPEQHITFLREFKAIRELSVVVGVFIFCWGPFHIWHLLTFYDPDVLEGVKNSLELYYIFDVVTSALPLFNSLCNPVIYVCLHHKYRDALKILLQKIMKYRPSLRRRQPLNGMELGPLGITTS